MADPISLFLFSAGAQGLGLLFQGRQQREIARYNARLAERNAAIARQNARVNEAAFRRSARRMQGARRAAIGASGLRGGGSALDVLADAAMEQELDALMIRYRGELEAMGFGQQAAADRFRADNAMTNAFVGAATALLTGGAQAISAGWRPPWSRGFNVARSVRTVDTSGPLAGL